jgi:hypothetical protein
MGLPLQCPKKQKPSMRSDSLRPLHLTLLLARRHGTTEVPARAYCTVPAPLSNSKPQVAADHDRAQRTRFSSTLVCFLYRSCQPSLGFGCALMTRLVACSSVIQPSVFQRSNISLVENRRSVLEGTTIRHALS